VLVMADGERDMQLLKLADAATGWNCDVLLDDSGTKPPPGGLLLRGLEHQGHNFAREVRVVGLWIEVEALDNTGSVTGTQQAFFTLDDTGFTVEPLEILRPIRVTMGTPEQGQTTFRYLSGSDDCLQFGTYFSDGTNPVGVGVRARFASKASLFAAWPNCEVSALTLTQVFLFSRYAMSPPHEPGGVITAARFHPIMKYEWSANAAVDRSKPYHRVKSLRVDYRINFYIDGALVQYSYPHSLAQAGIFADLAALPFLSWAPFGLFSSSATSRTVFVAAEKPVLLEVVAPGFVKGAPVGTTPAGAEFRCWDNIHVWGARGVGNPLISAPGAFHAAHMHWRWGSVTRDAPHGSKPTFRPGPLPPPPPGTPSRGLASEFTLLVDPAAWIQSMEFAVIVDDRALQPWLGVELSKLSTWEFRQLFASLRGSRPADISGGTDLVLWMAITVHRERTVAVVVPLKGSTRTVQVPHFTKPVGRLFIHGVFFAHEAEVTGLTTGTTDPQHFPTGEKAIRSAKQWYRTA
jgi:hypothetical protein